MTNATLKIFSLLLGFLAFIPLERVFGSLKGAEGSIGAYEWLLVSCSTLAICYLITSYAPIKFRNFIVKLYEFFFVNYTNRKVFIIFSLILLLILSFVFCVFENRPHLVDSIAQVFQAKIFANARVTAAIPSLIAPFITLHMLIDENGWYSQYPPGHSAVLALGYTLRLGWLLPRILAFLSAILIYESVKKIYNAQIAYTSLVLMLFCPFYLFMGASFMNHVSTLFFLSLFFYGYVSWEKNNNSSFLLLAGTGMGCAATIRPLTAIAFAIPFSFFALKKAYQDKDYISLLPGVFSASLFSSLFLVYNKFTTGSFLLPGYLKLWGKSHGLGFQESPWGEMHTPLTGLRNELIDIRLISEFLFEWPIPSLLPIALYFFFNKKNDFWSNRLLIGFLTIPITYFFYWHRDAFLGPRFMFEGIIYLIPLSAIAVSNGVSQLEKISIKKVNLGELTKTLFLLCIFYAVFISVPQRFIIYKSGFKSTKTNLLESAKEKGIEHGLIFISVSWGNRIIANLRGLGVSASLAQKSYSFTDHCLLYLLSERAMREQWPAEKLENELHLLIGKNHPIEKTSLINKDPTLKLRPGKKLDPQCIDEIRYDREGYSIFTPSLPLNNTDLSGPIVFARDLRRYNAKLLKFHPPDFPIYIYRGDKFTRLR